MLNIDHLLTRLPNAHQNGRADRIEFTCPLCEAVTAYVIVSGDQLKFNCPSCFKSAAIAAAMARLLEEEPSPPPPMLPAPLPAAMELREPGADEQEDEFQANVLRWNARVYQVAESMMVQDQTLRALEGEELSKQLTQSLETLVTQIPGYALPDGLSAEDMRGELERISHLIVPLKKPEKKAERPAVEVYDLGQLYSVIDEWDRQPWVWDGILPHKSLSLIVGKSETGKSTLMYSLIYSVIKGVPFLGRDCEAGRVLYLAGDPASEIVLGRLFRELGVTEGVTIMAGALVAHPSGLKLLRQVVEQVKPILVIADTLAATVPIDTDKYGQSYQTQQPLSILARQHGPNFLMSHHSQKSAVDSYSVIDSALGSVGVAAVASTRMGTKMYRRGGKRFYTFEMSNCRIGSALEGEQIVHKMDNGLVELNGLWASRNVEMDCELIINVLAGKGSLSKRTLWGEMRPKPKWGPFNDALDTVLSRGTVVESDSNKRGGGKLYCLSSQKLA